MNCDTCKESHNQTSNSFSMKKSRLPAYVFDPHQPNPQDQFMTDKYVEKLKSNSKKVNRQATIRKS